MIVYRKNQGERDLEKVRDSALTKIGTWDQQVTSHSQVGTSKT
jgi:hypothetical protein